MSLIWFTFGAFLGLALGAVGVLIYAGYAGRNLLSKSRLEAEKAHAARLREAENTARETELVARQAALVTREKAEVYQQNVDDQKAAFEQERAKQRREVEAREAKLDRREDALDRKADTLNHKERGLVDREKSLSATEKELAANRKELALTLEESKRQLQSLSGLTEDQARTMYLLRVEEECARDAGELIRRAMEHAQDESKEKARTIILEAIQRYAAEQTADHTVASIQIADDAMKGRVIGREGRNIRSFEKATGVDVIIDDTPGVVGLSCFDPVRREVARMSLERLIADGRIHPGRIEEVVNTTTTEMEETLIDLGKNAAHSGHVQNLARPIMPLLGRLHFRTSYGQNVLKHSLEVAHLAQVMADELGLDGTLARRAGLLHDIGKAIDHETEGGHPEIGADFLRKNGESEAVINAAAGHHGDVPATTPYTPLIMAADAISASRPGARRESLERYIKRLRELEELATEFKGVRQAYAIHAGREIRVIADAKALDDPAAAKLARDIATRIAGTLNFPGEIRITVLREVRSVEYAR